MSLQVTFGIEPVQNKTGREGEDQNQYQRVDAHTHAPVPLHVRDIRTENAPNNLAGAKYFQGVAKISQMARRAPVRTWVSRRTSAGSSICDAPRERKAPPPDAGARNTCAVIRFVRSTPADRAASALNGGDSWISFRVPPVQCETGRERNNQNQYQRFDAHANAPVACWRHGSTKKARQFVSTKIFAKRCKNPTDCLVTNTAIPRSERFTLVARIA
jgi:hypothetical protein